MYRRVGSISGIRGNSAEIPTVLVGVQISDDLKKAKDMISFLRGWLPLWEVSKDLTGLCNMVVDSI